MIMFRLQFDIKETMSSHKLLIAVFLTLQMRYAVI